MIRTAADLSEKALNELAKLILAGNRQALGRAITLIESSRQDHRIAAETLLAQVVPHSGNSLRIAISGIPGAGKSTLIEKLGTDFTAQNHKVAVLAVDPTSIRSGGSILGDKTRMNALATDQNAFIRPTPTSGTLGGVARRTRESILLCEAAGFDIIIIETVGVGQSEVTAADLVDIFVLVTLPGTGDELQGIKRGILEISDIVVVNKSDGINEDPARRAAAELKSSLHILDHREAESQRIFCVSSINGTGFEEFETHLMNSFETRSASGKLQKKRKDQLRTWLDEEVRSQSIEIIRNHAGYKENSDSIEDSVFNGKMTPSQGARMLIEGCLKS
jgi:LAO/AO transport system kinase